MPQCRNAAMPQCHNANAAISIDWGSWGVDKGKLKGDDSELGRVGWGTLGRYLGSLATVSTCLKMTIDGHMEIYDRTSTSS